MIPYTSTQKEVSSSTINGKQKSEAVTLITNECSVQFNLASPATVYVEYSVDGVDFSQADFTLSGTAGANMIDIGGKSGAKVRISTTVNMTNIKFLL